MPCDFPCIYYRAEAAQSQWVTFLKCPFHEYKWGTAGGKGIWAVIIRWSFTRRIYPIDSTIRAVLHICCLLFQAQISPISPLMSSYQPWSGIGSVIASHSSWEVVEVKALIALCPIIKLITRLN